MNTTREMFEYVDTLCRVGRYAEAHTYVDQLAATEPASAALRTLKGIIWSKEGKHAEALVAFDGALELDPQNPLIWSCKGSALFGVRRHEEASEAFKQAISTNPRDLIAQRKYVETLRYLSRDDEAMRATTTALSYFPNDTQLWIDQCALLIGQKRFESALETADHSLETSPTDQTVLAHIWQLKGMALQELHQYERALSAYEQAANYIPADPWTWHRMSQVLLKLRRFRRAFSAYWRTTSARSPFHL